MPGQFFPPFTGDGLSQKRCLVRSLGPQSHKQSPQADHSPQLPLAVNSNIQHMSCKHFYKHPVHFLCNVHRNVYCPHKYTVHFLHILHEGKCNKLYNNTVCITLQSVHSLYNMSPIYAVHFLQLLHESTCNTLYDNTLCTFTQQTRCVNLMSG